MIGDHLQITKFPFHSIAPTKNIPRGKKKLWAYSNLKFATGQGMHKIFTVLSAT